MPSAFFSHNSSIIPRPYPAQNKLEEKNDGYSQYIFRTLVFLKLNHFAAMMNRVESSPQRLQLRSDLSLVIEFDSLEVCH